MYDLNNTELMLASWAIQSAAGHAVGDVPREVLCDILSRVQAQKDERCRGVRDAAILAVESRRAQEALDWLLFDAVTGGGKLDRPHLGWGITSLTCRIGAHNQLRVGINSGGEMEIGYKRRDGASVWVTLAQRSPHLRGPNWGAIPGNEPRPRDLARLLWAAEVVWREGWAREDAMVPDSRFCAATQYADGSPEQEEYERYIGYSNNVGYLLAGPPPAEESELPVAEPA